MRPGIVFKIFTWLVCFLSFIYLGGFSCAYAGSEAKSLPIGQMISNGFVTIQTGEKAWRNAEPASFPAFPGMTIKTEKGTAAISLGDRNQIEIGPNSVLALERKDQIRLTKGNLDFRIAARKGLSLCAGKIIVVATLPLQAGKIALPASGVEQALGSLVVHAGGAVTIQASQGHLTVLDQERIVVAAISPNGSLTIPAAIAGKESKGKDSPLKKAQVGEEEEPAAAKKEEAGPEKVKKTGGLSGTTWAVIGIGALAVGGIAAAAGGGGGGGGGSACP